MTELIQDFYYYLPLVEMFVFHSLLTGLINDLVSKVSSLRNQLFAEHIQAKIQIIKTTGFNPAACEKPKQIMPCVGNTCKVPLMHIGPNAGFKTAPHQGLHVGPRAGMQISKQKMQQKLTKPTNETTENSLWQ